MARRPRRSETLLRAGLEKAEAEAAQKAEKAERLRRKKLADQKKAIEEPARRKRRSLEKARAKLALGVVRRPRDDESIKAVGGQAG